MSLISKVKLPGQNTPYDIGVQWDNVKNKPTLATVATSGDYNDLSNIPDDKIQIFTATATENNFLGYTIYTLNCTLTEFNNAFNSKMVYIKYPNAQGKIEIRQAQTGEAFTLGSYSGYQYELTPMTEVDMDGGITVKGQTMIFLSTNQVLFPWPSSKQIIWSDNAELREGVTGKLNDNIVVDVNYNHTDNNFTNNLKTKLENLEIPTNVSAFTNDANYVTQTQLNNATAPSSYPHFEVSYNGSFSCYYVGSLPNNVNDVTTALQCDEVKYAMRQLIPVYSNGTQVFIGSADIIDIDDNIGMEIRFPDAIDYSLWLVNGIKGVLTYDSSQTHPLYLTNINITTPYWITNNGSKAIVSKALGNSQIGSSTTPVYWTGSGLAEAPIPTNISTFTNDANYINQTQLNNAISNINSFNVQVVASLPTTNIDTHTIYFISNSGSGQNIYDEYMYLNNKWEKIGTTDIDLSGYLTSSDFTNVSAYTSGGQVTQVSFTSGAAFTIAEGTVTANSAYQSGGTISQTPFGTTTTSHVNS